MHDREGGRSPAAARIGLEPAGSVKNVNWLKWALNAAILIGLVLVAVRYLNVEDVLNAFARFDYIYAPFMAALAAAYLALKSWRFVWLMRPVSDLRWGVPFRAYAAGQAATIVPGGVAARAALMKQAGVPISKSSAPVALSSILDQVVFITSSLVAALFFPVAREAALILLVVVAVVVLLLAVPFTRSALAGAAGGLAGRLGIGGKWQDFLEAMSRVVTPRLMLVTLGITVVAFALKVIILDLSLRGLGFDVAYPTLFLVYILPTMLGRLSALPAGVGLTEATMVGFLVAVAGMEAEPATAASVIFRIATVVVEAALGAVVYFFFWRGDREGGAAAPRTEPADTADAKGRRDARNTQHDERRHDASSRRGGASPAQDGRHEGELESGA